MYALLMHAKKEGEDRLLKEHDGLGQSVVSALAAILGVGLANKSNDFELNSDFVKQVGFPDA